MSAWLSEFRPRAASLFDATERLDAGLALYSRSGDVLYRNRSIRALLEQSEHRETLRRAIAATLMDAAARIQPRDWRGMPPIQRLTEQELDTGSTRFRMRTSWITSDFFDLGAAIMVTLEAVHSRSPMEEQLRQRFGLTRKQCKIVALLAEGRSNQSIAAELSISPHTARNHTKAILAKLGVTSRAQVAPLLQRLSEK